MSQLLRTVCYTHGKTLWGPGTDADAAQAALDAHLAIPGNENDDACVRLVQHGMTEEEALTRVEDI
jgi:hypothetical protein